MANELTRLVDNFICEKIDAMGVEELQAVIRDCDSLTTTNCSWIRYGLRNIVKEVAEAQLSGLTQRAADGLRAVCEHGATYGNCKVLGCDASR